MAYKSPITYKDRPLVRFKDELYYGNLDAKYLLKLKILSTRKDGNDEVADRIQILLLESDDSRPEADRVMRHSERNGLYNALDIGKVWLDSALNQPT